MTVPRLSPYLLCLTSAFNVAGVACECNSREIVDQESRTLEAAIGEQRVIAELTRTETQLSWSSGGGNHFVPGCTPPHTRHAVAATLALPDAPGVVNESGEGIAFGRSWRSDRVEQAGERAREVYDAVSLQACADEDGSRMAVRVSGSDWAPPFRLIYWFENEGLTAEGPSTSCEEALSSAPDRETWLRGAVESCTPHAAAFAVRHRTNLEELLRCHISDVATQRTEQVERGRLLAEAVAQGSASSPDLEAALFAALTPTPDPNSPERLTVPHQLRGGHARELLQAAPTPDRRHAYARQLSEVCRADAATDCTTALAVAAELAAEPPNPETCDAIAATLGARLTGGVEADQEDVRALQLLGDCASEREVLGAAVAMIAAAREEPLSAYHMADCAVDIPEPTRCDVPSLAVASLLANRCTGEVVAQASALLTEADAAWIEPADEADGAPRLSVRAAAALRLIAACGDERHLARAVAEVAGDDEAKHAAVALALGRAPSGTAGASSGGGP